MPAFDSKYKFDTLLKNINRNPGTLRLPPRGNEKANKYLNLGYVPLHHALRGGDKTISWYHSPLSTGESRDQLSKPVPMADELMQFRCLTA